MNCARSSGRLQIWTEWTMLKKKAWLPLPILHAFFKQRMAKCGGMAFRSGELGAHRP
ncbi:FAD-binding PCMH-type domain-containing protein [Psidium guajava]|nr:FAD-binding PCMH-type domain-containing protein [Psidium guajava]